MTWPRTASPSTTASPRQPAPSQTRSLRSHAKTDPIDACGLTRYGLERHGQLALWQPPSRSQSALRELVRLRADLVATRADYARRMAAPGKGPHTPHLRTLIRQLDKQIGALEGDIDKLIEADLHLARTVEVIDNIPGCGTVTAFTIAALMPEIGQISRRQAAALSGTAPHPRKSGQADAYRSPRGGRPEIKRILFMAAMAARRHNPQLRAFYENLIQAGKKKIVAIIALARKLITIINAKIRDELYNQQNQLS